MSEYPDRIEIGKRIKKARLAKGLTVQQLAEAAEISRGYISQIERGQSAITVEKLAQIAGALKKPLGDLLLPLGDELSGDDADHGKFATGSNEVRGAHVKVPTALSNAANQLNLAHAETLRLAQARDALLAADRGREEWTINQWRSFYRRVKVFTMTGAPATSIAKLDRIQNCATLFQDIVAVTDITRVIKLTDGVCLRSKSEIRFAFFKRDTELIPMDLSEMQPAQPAIAVDARNPAMERNVADDLSPEKDYLWQAPYRSDWAIAVGDFQSWAWLDVNSRSFGVPADPW